MTMRSLRLLWDEDERLERDAPNEWFHHYRATQLALLIELAQEVDQVLRKAMSRMER